MSTYVIVAKIPDCDIHAAAIVPTAVPAAVDAKMKRGPWAYMCTPCFAKYGLGKLGTGYGQRLVLTAPEPVKDVPDEEVLAIRIGGQHMGCSDSYLD